MGGLPVCLSVCASISLSHGEDGQALMKNRKLTINNYKDQWRPLRRELLKHATTHRQKASGTDSLQSSHSCCSGGAERAGRQPWAGKSVSIGAMAGLKRPSRPVVLDW